MKLRIFDRIFRKQQQKVAAMKIQDSIVNFPNSITHVNQIECMEHNIDRWGKDFPPFIPYFVPFSFDVNNNQLIHHS